MSKFIKLTKMMLNTNDIHKILIIPNKYCIHFTSKQFHGAAWGLSIVGFGSVSSHNEEVEVCETTHPIDYKIVSEWIANN